MVLRLDQRHPLVWRSPTSVQFGVGKPAVVLENVDLATEKIITALGPGISRSGLSMIGRAAGASDEQVAALVDRLEPTLEQPRATASRTVLVAGYGRLADRIARLLAGEHSRVLLARDADAAERSSCDLAIAIGHFVLDPRLHGLWLRRDIPHLPVILGDSFVAVGPLVQPGRSACLFCLQRHATDADPAWPAIASQLWGRRSPADTELVASEVAAIVSRVVRPWQAGEGDPASEQLVIDVATGARESRRFAIHPDCGCLEAGTTNAAAQRETGSDDAARHHGSKPQPRRSTGASAPS